MAHPVRCVIVYMKHAIRERWLKTTESRAATALCRAKISIRTLLLAVFCTIAIFMPGCGSSSGSGAPSGPPAVVTVAIQPGSASLFLGQTLQFQATVTGVSNTSVIWSVSGITGGNSSVGTISPAGLYTAPGTLPATAGVTVTASSSADPQATGSAVVSLKGDIVVSIAPTSVAVATGAGQAFAAIVTATGSPSTAVTWSVNGIAGGNATLGTIAPNGTGSALFTAPALVPSPPSVSVTATSIADATKSATADVTITCSAINSIVPAAPTVALLQTQSFAASFCLTAGASIVWDVNGIAGGNSAIGTIAITGSSAALYSAPGALPSPNTVTIHATGGTAVASASVTLVSDIVVSVAPPSSSLAMSQRASFNASVANAADTTVTWLVNGVTNGSTAVGQICQTASNPCVAPSGPASGSVDYLAPASIPAPNPVTLTAVSHADPSKSGQALVTITAVSGPVSVAISPLFAFVAPSTSTLSTEQFFAVVTGGSNRNVTWRVQSAVAGQGCAGTACGTVDVGGVFTAPAAAPSPNAISIVATSQADPTKSASATIAITSGPMIDVILPSSVMAGSVESFPLTVQGSNFITGGGSTGSTILLNGAARSTTCPSTTSCSTALNPVDLQSAGTITVQIKNPGAPGTLSNLVPFVIAPFDSSEDIIPLTSSQPAAAGKNIIVVEPTTAAASAAIDVDFDGFLLSSSCQVEGTPLSVTRPASGSTIVSLCIHGNGLDPTFTYVFTGPGTAPGDIPITATVVNGLFPNTIELDVTIANTTIPGVRTLFITTLNADRASATGILEVK